MSSLVCVQPKALIEEFDGEENVNESYKAHFDSAENYLTVTCTLETCRRNSHDSVALRDSKQKRDREELDGKGKGQRHLHDV